MTAALPPDFSGSTEDRATYLGGSEIAAVAGLSPYATALDVWAAKVDGVRTVATEAMDTGTHFEGAIVSWYAQRRSVPLDSLRILGTVRHAVEPWIAATPDRVLPAERCILQAKMVGVRSAHRWGDEDEGADGVPAEVLAQVQWELLAVRGAGIVEADMARVVAQIGTEQRVYEVAYDDEFAGGLVEIGRAFWVAHIVGRRMPEITVDGAESARQALARKYPRQIRGMAATTPAVVELVRMYDAARGAAKAAKAEQEYAAARLEELIAEGAGFEGDGVKVTWGNNKSGGTDWKGLAASMGATSDQIAAHARPGARVLRVTTKEE